MPGSGRRRQATTPLRRQIRRDLLGWGALAGIAAGLVLGATGGGWTKALVLGLLVVAGCAVLTVLASFAGTTSTTRARPGPPADPKPPPDGPGDGAGDGSDP